MSIVYSVSITDLTLILTSEFKEAFPAGRFRPVCKIQAKRGASSAAVADQIKPPEWWHSTHIIQAFDGVLQDKVGNFFKNCKQWLSFIYIVQEAFIFGKDHHVWCPKTASPVIIC